MESKGIVVLLRYLILFVFGIFLMWFLRVVFILRFGDLELIKTDYLSDIFETFWVGMRFDSMILSYVFLPIFIAYLLGRFMPSIQEKCWNFPFVYLKWMFPFLIFIAVADQQYYFFFQSHFNILMFGLMDDDTAAVMTSVWTDHPIIRLVIIIVVFTYLNAKTMNWVANLYFKPRKKVFAFVMGLLFIPSYGMAFRGSIGIFPIQQDDASFSVYRFLNVASINALYSFKSALKEYNNSKSVLTQKALDQKYGFSSVAEAYKVFSGEDVDKSSSIEDLMFRKSPKHKYLENKKPHVVVLVMEGMGRHFGDLHSEQLNTLGGLAPHFEEDFLFKNALSGENGTMYSIEDLITYCPMHVVAQSPYRYQHFESSVSDMFSKQGFETSFVFGGKTSWRNLEDFLTVQGFQHVAGMVDLKKSYPDASQCEWGVHDEHLLDYVWDHLNDHKENPQFIMSMSISNHTPFDLPDTHQEQALLIPDSVEAKIKSAKEFAVKNIKTYQYAADQVGRFMDKLKQSDLAENTIVVVTGDHNNWLVFDYPEQEIKNKYAVPLYFYIPEEYRSNIYFDANRAASFKDIFPTIVNRIFSETEYFGLGNDLMAPDSLAQFYFAANARKNFMSKYGMTTYNSEYTSLDTISFGSGLSDAASMYKERYQTEEEKYRAYQYLIDSYFHKIFRGE